jgi:hypothetical protein
MGKTTVKDFGWFMFARTVAWNVLHNAAATLGFGVASYREPTRHATLRTIRELRKRLDMNVTPLEAVQLFSLVRATAKLGGAMAEVGVYQGGSARLIREADTSRPLHLFDTFAGMPEPAASDTKVRRGPFRKGQYSCSLEVAKSYLADCDKVHFHQGVFPATGEAVKDEKFSFVHSDVDLYSSTRGVLEFFYPRLLPGGIIISHDFALSPGVSEAMQEFFRDRPEPVIVLPGDQAMVVKL